MKYNVAGIILFVFWTVLSILPFAAFHLERAQYHKGQFPALSAAHPGESVCTFTFDRFSEVTWETKGREFLFNGHLYDVLSLDMTADGVIIECVADVREDILVTTYYRSLGPMGQTDGKTQNHEKPHKNPNTVTYFCGEIAIVQDPFKSTLSTIAAKDNFLSAVYREIVTPPPEYRSC